MQIILRWGYHSIRSARGKEFDLFIDKCTLEYVRDLHVKGEVALHNDLYDYGELDEGGAD
ncbi:hypothetical protein [Paraburkholderia bannensis]|uniref:hypothetical protein n=1 Tax=Paraburkholderia bannensis TaxID=765414 RepID=UPI002AB6CF13|nr:hypothetical protein [Paraburkholderia bannensis]